MLCILIALTLALKVRRRSAAADLDAKYSLHELFDKLDSIERYEGHRPKPLAVFEKQR
jgi:hypothetical protein